MSKPLRVLLVEDSQFDAELIVHKLRAGGFDPLTERVDTAAAMRGALKEGSWDIIIADYSMPQFDGRAALSLYQELGLEQPFICVSGTLGEEEAVEMMKAGAHDYVMKTDLARLPAAVERELAAARARLERRRAEEAAAHFAALVESSNDAIFSKSLDGNVLSWNPGAERLFGYSAAEIIGRSVAVLIPSDRSAELSEVLGKIRNGRRIKHFETVRLRKDGQAISVSLTISPVKDPEGRVIGASTIARDITERKRHEDERLRLIEELTAAVAHARLLTGMLPICASCKKIRDDRGYWQQVETYIAQHSEADFTHGICPDCAKRLYPEVDLSRTASTPSSNPISAVNELR